MNYSKIFFVFIINVLFFNRSIAQNKPIESRKQEPIFSQKLPLWEKGYLDIHHINTGSGDASFFILPDGTTMVFDAGNLDKIKFEEKYKPLKASSPVPSDSLTASQWIAHYIKKMLPKDIKTVIDYGIVSHFHEDHYGSFVNLCKQIPVKKIIDRNYPNYDFPLDLRKYLSNDHLFQDYLTLIEKYKIPTESLVVGSDTQIKLINSPEKYPNFKIRNIKSNATIWTGEAQKNLEYFKPDEMTGFYKGKYNENTLSLALKVSYGDFDYFMGGDNTGLQGYGLPEWFDVETPIAKVVGRVEVATLNHHGNRDATNEFFVKTLDPKVVIQQSWCSDHPGQEVYQRLIYKDVNFKGRDIFATNIHPETVVTYGPWFKDNYKSQQGHIVVRVYPEGREFEVFILDDTTKELKIKEKFGPYYSK